MAGEVPADAVEGVPSNGTTGDEAMASDNAAGAKDLQSGDVVEILNLKAAADLNGQQATLWRLDSSSGRWEVKFADGAVKALRPDNLVYRSMGPVEDDGTLALVGMATDHAAIQRFLQLLEKALPQANEALILVNNVISPTCGGGAKGEEASIWMSLGRQAEQRVRGLLEDVQQHVEAVDSISMERLQVRDLEDLKMARRDLIRFVQGLQERLEVALRRLQPMLRRLSAEAPAISKARRHSLSSDAREDDLHEKYQEIFKKKPDVPSVPEESSGTAVPSRASLKPLVVKYQGKGESPPPSDNLYVKDLPGWVVEADIQAIFSEVGEVQSMKLKTADWGAIAFVRLNDKQEATRAIQQFNGTVPERLAARAAESEQRKLEEAIAKVRLQSVVTQLEKGLSITVDLERPLGVMFNDDLTAKDVQAGSQAVDLGITKGWRARSVGGAPLKTTKELVKKISSLKSEGKKQISIAFSPPPLVVTFDERPFGLVINRDSDFGLVVVNAADGAAEEKGVRPGAILTSVGGLDVSNMQQEEVVDVLRKATLPITLVFEQTPPRRGRASADGKVDSSTEQMKEALALRKQERENGDADNEVSPTAVATGAWRLEQGSIYVMDLSQPLGIFFDDQLGVKEVDEGSQAARLGIVKGSRGRSIGGVRVRTTDELVAKVQALKAQKIPKVNVSFSPPALVAKFPERPFGMTVSHDRALGLYVVTEVSGISAAAGVKAGMALTTVAGTDVHTLRLTKLIELLREIPLPASLIFEVVPQEQPAKTEDSDQSTLKRKAAHDSGPTLQEEQAAKKLVTETTVKVDLSLPLGIFFDERLVAKGVQEGSQADKAGVCKGWRALAAAGEPIQKTADLVDRIKALKAQKVASVNISFAHEISSAASPVADATPSTVAPDVTEAKADSADADPEARSPQKRKASDVGEPAAARNMVPKLEARRSEPVSVRISLSEPLGIFFDDKLGAKDVQEGSQAAKVGVCKGWRVSTVEGDTVQTTKELVSRIKALKATAASTATLTFVVEGGSTAATASSSAPATSIPVQASSTTSTSSMPVQESGHRQNGKGMGDTSSFDMNVDLSSPLGIFFDDKLTVKSVQDGSQAAKVGVSQGWQACTLEGEPIQTTKDLVSRIKAMKAKGVGGACLVFSRGILASSSQVAS